MLTCVCVHACAYTCPWAHVCLCTHVSCTSVHVHTRVYVVLQVCTSYMCARTRTDARAPYLGLASGDRHGLARTLPCLPWGPWAGLGGSPAASTFSAGGRGPDARRALLAPMSLPCGAKAFKIVPRDKVVARHHVCSCTSRPERPSALPATSATLCQQGRGRHRPPGYVSHFVKLKMLSRSPLFLSQAL